MKVFVAMVSFEDGRGSYVLAVRRAQEAAQEVCLAHWRHQLGDVEKTLEWAEYRDANNGTRGVQAINADPHLTYYVEGTELDFEMDTKIDRRVLDLEVRLGQLAQGVKDQMGMWIPLEERQIVLEGHIDHLLHELSRHGVDTTNYTFPDGELWGRNEKV